MWYLSKYLDIFKDNAATSLISLNSVLITISMVLQEKYTLYDNKIHSGAEAAEGDADLRRRMAEIGYELVIDRGDWVYTEKLIPST